MSKKNLELPDNQEIDLSLIPKNIGTFFDKLSAQFFQGVLWVIKNIKILVVLIVVGFGLGYFLDNSNKSYLNQIIVTPNYGSTDYLYAKIDLINSKVSDRDDAFLKETIKLKKTDHFRSIKIEPITDVYKFIESNTANFEFIKLLAEDGDIKKIVEDNLTSKNYPYHIITIVSEQQESENAILNPILNYLNASNHYEKVRKTTYENIKLKISQNDSVISQIDGFLNAFKNTTNSSQKSDKLIYYNENTQLNDVIKTKDALNSELGSLRMQLVNSDKTIKDVSVTTNIKNDKGLANKLKFVLPILFVFIFLLFGFFKSYYLNQLSKLQE